MDMSGKAGRDRWKLKLGVVLGVCGLFLLGLFDATISIYMAKGHGAKPVTAIATLAPSQFQAENTRLVSLMKSKGINVAFSYVTAEIATDPSFAKSCHPLLHELGHAAYAYYGGYAQAIVYQNELCDSGNTHGVLESYLESGSDLQAALQAACPTGMPLFDEWQCYHGLGHGAMLVSLGNIQKSISLCDRLPAIFAQDACTNGVFMQHFVVTDHEGNIPKANPTGLSDRKTQPSIYKTSRYIYAPTAFLTIHSDLYALALQWCQGAEPGYISACSNGVGTRR